MKIVWDKDGTLYQDTGVYNNQPQKEAPLMILLQFLSIFTNQEDCQNILITGSTEDQLQKNFKGLFTKIYCRDFPLEPLNTYYARYFQWKVDLIISLHPDLVFDDDQQICRFLNKSGIPAVWVPSCSYNGL